MKPREKNALQVNHKLIAKFANHPAIKRINNHRQVPKHVYNATNEMRSSVLAKKRKYESACFTAMINLDRMTDIFVCSLFFREFNVSTHTKRPAPPVPEIAQVVVSEQ